MTVCDNSLYALTRCTDGSVKVGEFHFSHEKFLMKYGNNVFGRMYASLRTRRLENAVRKLDRFVVLTMADKEDWEKVRPDVEQIYNPLSLYPKMSHRSRPSVAWRQEGLRARKTSRI